MPDSLKECLPQHRWEWLLLAGALGVACLLRLQGMGDPLSHDEVYGGIRVPAVRHDRHPLPGA